MENRNWKKYFHFFMIFLGLMDGFFTSTILAILFPHVAILSYATVPFVVAGGFLGQTIYKKVSGNVLPVILSVGLTFILFYSSFYLTYFRK